MSKDPAFLFYPGDWTLGTMHMSLLEKGAYFELLMLQFARGKFTEAHAKHMLKDSFDLAWPHIKEKFQTDGEHFWNTRLQEETEKRLKFTESRRNNASTVKKEEAKQKHMPEHMHEHMEDENKNENESKDQEKREESEKGKGKIWTDTVITFYSKLLPLFDVEYHPKTASTTDRWLDTIDKLIRIDKRTPDQIYQLIKKVRADRFWNQNFRSVCKLRDKDKDDIQYLVVFEKKFNGIPRTATPNQNIHDFMDRKAQEILDKYGPDKPVIQKQNGK